MTDGGKMAQIENGEDREGSGAPVAEMVRRALVGATVGQVSPASDAYVTPRVL
jgi:hypothetical protein